MDALREHFKPELLNRMDDIIMFHSLNAQHFVKIAEKYAKQLQNRLFDQEITLKVEDSVIQWIVEEGTDAAFGARPLKRFIQRHLETAVAKLLIGGTVLPGSKVVAKMEEDVLKIMMES